MKVLVIGGAGLFGRKTVLRLLQEEDISTVVSMDMVPPKDWIMKRYAPYGEKFQFVRGSVAELEEILDVIRRFDIDRIVNWAFMLPGAVEAAPRMSIKVNFMGMCNVFEAARLTGIKRVVYASSEGVYGPQTEYGDREVTEDDPIHPGSPYAIAKQVSEILAAQYAGLYGLNLTGLRPTTGCGHGGASPLEIRQFSEIISLPAVGKPFTVDYDGTAPYSLFTPDDIGEITCRLLNAESSPHPVYNIGTLPYTLKDVAAVVKQYIPEAVIEFGKAAPRDRSKSGLPWRVSTERVLNDFGFTMRALEDSVLVHINDARMEAGLEPITL